MDIGAELRRARIARKLSIEDVSHVTKISPSVLRAIEKDEFRRVPGGLFTRGFLRSYAREVGLDGEDIIQQYRAEYEAPVSVGVSGQAAPTESDELEYRNGVNDEPGGSRLSQLIQVAVILIVMFVYFASWRQPKPSASAHGDLPATNAIGTPSPVEVPVATTGSTDAAPAGLKMEVRPQGQCWVQVTADGKIVIARLMEAGERQTIDAREDLTLRVGDPATFAFSINGVAGRPVGPAGKPVTIHITPQNYQTFLESRRPGETPPHAAVSDREHPPARQPPPPSVEQTGT
jgi:cytoskeletal protein RodZ